MKKVRALSEEKIDEISALIGVSFWDYPYEPGEVRTATGCKIYDLMYSKKGAD